MELSGKHVEYWRRSLRMTSALIVVWFVATFVASYFAVPLNHVTILGFPLGFYMAAQGSLVIYVLIIWFYARHMNRLDHQYGVDEAEED